MNKRERERETGKYPCLYIFPVSLNAIVAVSVPWSSTIPLSSFLFWSEKYSKTRVSYSTNHLWWKWYGDTKWFAPSSCLPLVPSFVPVPHLLNPTFLHDGHGENRLLHQRCWSRTKNVTHNHQISVSFIVLEPIQSYISTATRSPHPLRETCCTLLVLLQFLWLSPKPSWQESQK